jgi:hypothetical protein
MQAVVAERVLLGVELVVQAARAAAVVVLQMEVMAVRQPIMEVVEVAATALVAPGIRVSSSSLTQIPTLWRLLLAGIPSPTRAVTISSRLLVQGRSNSNGY